MSFCENAVEMVKKMGEITLGHSENVMRVAEGLCNGGVAVTTDKDGNQGIFTPASRKGSFKSLEMFKKIAEKNGLTVSITRPEWAKDGKYDQDDDSEEKKEEKQQQQKPKTKKGKVVSVGIINKKMAETVARHLIEKGLDPNQADEWFVDDDGKYKSMTTGEIPSQFDDDGSPTLVSRGELRYKYDTETGKMTEVDSVVDPSNLGDLDIELDEKSKKATVKGKGVNREMAVEDLTPYHEGLMDACKMMGIDIPKLLDGKGEAISKEEAAKFLNSKEGKKVVAEVVAKLTGELGGGDEKKTEAPKSEKKEEKKQQPKDKGEKKEKKVPYQFKEPDEKSRDFLNKHVKVDELDTLMAGDDFDDKRRNYVKNVIISEIEWAYKRGDKFFPKEDDFVKFDVEQISKNNVIYLRRPDIRMVIVPFRWDRKIYRVFTNTEDEAKNIAEINAWIEGKVREEEVRNQQEAAKKAEQQSKAEGSATTSA